MLRSEHKQDQLQKINCTQPNEPKIPWNKIESTICTIHEHQIGFNIELEKQEWMKSEILEIMEETINYNTKGKAKYKENNRTVRNKCKEAKERYMTDKCKELQCKYDTFNVHTKKKLSGKNCKQQTAILKVAKNNILTGNEDKLKRWREYVETLFYVDGPTSSPLEDIKDSGTEVTKDEVVHAMK